MYKTNTQTHKPLTSDSIKKRVIWKIFYQSFYLQNGNTSVYVTSLQYCWDYFADICQILKNQVSYKH